MPRFLTIPPDNWAKARKMRRNPTRAEHEFWKAVRRSALNAVFRRQHPIGPYIVDFVCLDKRLVIELDGGGHTEATQVEYDRAREEYLVTRGFRVLRYFNSDVLKNLTGVLEAILKALKE